MNENGVTQSDLARRVGTTQPVVSAWLRGVEPSGRFLVALEEATGLPGAAIMAVEPVECCPGCGRPYPAEADGDGAALEGAAG